MPPGARPINPVGDLAAIYRARIPQPTPRQLFGPQAVARIQPNMRRGPGVLGTIANVGKQVISSFDPRFILSQGGKSVQHVAGDVKELARSIVSGEDTLSESPTARVYQAGGEGLTGTLAAALPYVNVATAVVPTTKLLTPAGRVALGADAAERASQTLLQRGLDDIGRREARLAALPSSMTSDDVFAAMGRAESPSEVRRIRSTFERQLLDDYVARRAAAAKSLPDIPAWYEDTAAQRWKAWADSVPIQFGEANRAAIEAMPENPFAKPPTISVSGPNLRSVLESGKYGSMFDEGAGLNRRGTDYENWRRHNEYLLYGEGSQPVYGFLRNPDDIYAASAYGIDRNIDGYSTTTAGDNFFISIRPNRRITSAPADSFRVNTPEEVLPLTSADKPHASGYREVQMWGGQIPTSDIMDAELVIPDPQTLFQTIVTDTETNTLASLNQLINRIDAYLGPNGTVTQLEDMGIPLKVTVKRDFGRAPASMGNNVREALGSIRAQASDLINQLESVPTQQQRQYFNTNILPSIEKETLDPRTLYAYQLAISNNPEAAANAMRMANAGNNANPFWIPSQYGYTFGKMFEQLDPDQVRAVSRAFFDQAQTLHMAPGIEDVAVIVSRNDAETLADVLPFMMDSETLDRYVADAFDAGTGGYNAYESMLQILIGPQTRTTFRNAAQILFEKMSPERRLPIEQLIKRSQEEVYFG